VWAWPYRVDEAGRIFFFFFSSLEQFKTTFSNNPIRPALKRGTVGKDTGVLGRRLQKTRRTALAKPGLNGASCVSPVTRIFSREGVGWGGGGGVTPSMTMSSTTIGRESGAIQRVLKGSTSECSQRVDANFVFSNASGLRFWNLRRDSERRSALVFLPLETVTPRPSKFSLKAS